MQVPCHLAAEAKSMTADELTPRDQKTMATLLAFEGPTTLREGSYEHPTHLPWYPDMAPCLPPLLGRLCQSKGERDDTRPRALQRVAGSCEYPALRYVHGSAVSNGSRLAHRRPRNGGGEGGAFI